MKNFKKVSAIVLLLCMVFAFASCGQDKAASTTTPSQTVSVSKTSDKDNSNTSEATSESTNIKPVTITELLSDESFSSTMDDMNKAFKDMLKVSVEAENDETLQMRFDFVQEYDKDIKKNIEDKMTKTLQSSMKSMVKVIKSTTQVEKPVVHMLMYDVNGTKLFDKKFN